MAATETIQYPESSYLHCKCDCLPFEGDRWETLKTKITSIPLHSQDQKPNVYLFGAIQIDVFSTYLWNIFDFGSLNKKVSLVEQREH